MLKFITLNKLKTIIILNILVKYSAWCLFFIFQGKAINLAIEKSKFPQQLFYSLLAYLSIKILVMICDIFQKFITAYYKNIETKIQWSRCFPIKIYSDTKNKKNHVNILFFDYFPKIFDLEVLIICNQATIIYIFIFMAALFIYSGFYIEIIALLLVFALNYLSKNIFTSEIDARQTEINDNHINILNWIDQYFASFKEISKNWKDLAHATWLDDIYKNYFYAKKTQIFFHLYRDLLSQLLVDLPFLLNTSIVIIGVYSGHLTVTELFVWIGFSQFMINASNACCENKLNRKQLSSLSSKARIILNDLKPKIPLYTKGWSRDERLTAEVILRDGTVNTLSTEPGIYHIKGNNGSGKSTLLNLILDYERQDLIFKNINLRQLTLAIKQDHVRVIERDAVVFDCLDNFTNQVCGPSSVDHSSWKLRINKSLDQLLDKNLARCWKEIFISLELEYANQKTKNMSSGQKVILSFMRFLASWNAQVTLLIVDECDSFLDHDKKSLFMQAINNFSSHMAVYICSHSYHLVNQNPFFGKHDV